MILHKLYLCESNIRNCYTRFPNTHLFTYYNYVISLSTFFDNILLFDILLFDILLFDILLFVLHNRIIFLYYTLLIMNIEDDELLGFLSELEPDTQIVVKLKHFINNYNHLEKYKDYLHLWLQQNKYNILIELERKWTNDDMSSMMNWEIV